MPTELKAVALIPARWASSRFPGKPLAQIQHKPMIQWVVERTRKANRVSDVIVATDDTRIMEAVQRFGGKAVLTGSEHETGSDRIAEVASQLDCDIVVNVQGDEPLIPPSDIDLVISCLDDDPALSVASLMMPIHDWDEIIDPDVVKVVADVNGKALYFSRAPVPFHRDEWKRGMPEEITKSKEPGLSQVFKHIGLYAYTRKFLLEFTRWEPTILENIEKLEQLRILERGVAIKLKITDHKSFGVDRAEDLEKVERFLESGKHL
ncbi:MAG: 3-deoxy-manno-octulosonate cytidylyltransferase [Nitrospinaceae bacterium]|nr:3-deoxy-manno-octulosonate cytidylyltransferase [Nitrospinaceae bacterium]NIR54608.1 3-deoxy-manno-octulosonate cytidylyltransferase [Nitrospinaceae bacterium]NIT81841.1 3-deoxy-manno-octulosonate cytidylyltransferase [Nitrospinaceae bacterium]NIU44104.1 3-deoxy-manno-octulosonate cytidylyltransferase [Nitrospinaceae bacterium]NIW05700.1 3-deoxy-manno-octulosonate cytidylyltransferase [Nitrospinaceae bacterium]